ncbi:carboxypeptidase-like regulatory domain-containing protein [Christiangramia sediminis]|uniref:Carboxypeptidase-like regulatory domain-containing protein n=1 Tax=Christiangramia sediminis TaxID=2881336 RepID=A0A9X1RVJ7_9FLAO|nr:carboxypeptidase-like regulatory domain-containing protein [Christiangramia sediminis]MCB7481128.1 carboxypeptidase-like regulatory domain-containing protein [Christiangramia sediminis]
MIRKIKARYWPFLLLLCFADFDLFSQEIKLLEGQILSDSISPANIHIVNLDLEKGTTSNNSGIFRIYAKAGNRILFSSVQFENREIIISTTDLDSGKIQVKLFPARNELDEVSISDLKLSGHLDTDLPKISYFDREKYGIPYPEKKLSQTERRLYTANQNITSRWQYIGVLLGGVSLDVVLNDINGRTKYLKNLDKQDKLQILVQHGIDVLGRSFFILDLGLPESEIENFVYYCAREPEFKIILDSSNSLDLIEYYKNRKQDFINLRELNDTSKN